MALTLWVVMTATFFLVRLAPGGPFDTDRALPVEIKNNVDRQFGLDQPMPVQYWNWLSKFVQGDWSESYQYQGRSVLTLIRDACIPSLWVGLGALLLAVTGGVGWALLAVWKPRSWVVPVGQALGALGQSIPSYLLASLLVLIFAVTLHWVPVALVEEPSGYILPIIVTAARPCALIYQLMHDSLSETIRADFIRSARAKGLDEWRVVSSHALRNSWMALLGVSGPMMANILTGSFIVENIFQIPGLGKHFVSSVLNRDYPLVMGLTVTYGACLLLANRGTEILMTWVDPRVARARI